MKNPNIAVVIIHYSDLSLVQECLRSLKSSKNSHWLTPIIVDNAAKQPAEDLLPEFGGWIYLVKQQSNLGFTGGNNAGVNAALKQLSPDTIILLNDDTTIASDSIIKLHEKLHEKKSIGAVVPKIYFSAGREFHAGYKRTEIGSVIWYAGGIIDWTEVVAFHRGVDEVDRGQFNESQSTQFATGCCLAIKPAAIKNRDVFDNRYFLYFEDVELSCRLKKNGWEIVYEPQSVIWHKNAGSSSSGSNLHVYYQTRNKYLFGFTYAPLRSKLFLLKRLFTEYRTGTEPVKSAILDFILHRYGKRDKYHHAK